MNKVFYLILISLFSLTIISCAKKDDSSSISNSTDNSSVTLNISSFVIDTTLAAGTITGGVLSQNNDSDLSGVSVSFEKSGTTVDTTTTDSSGDFSQILTLGTYTITYSKSGYLDEIQSVTLAADNQTLVASTLKMLPDSCTSGTISGTIKDAVNNNPVTGVSLSVRRGVNVTTGTIAKSDTTSNTGTYSLSSMSAGWYTVETSKSGYITSTFDVYACGDISGQNTSISTTLSTGAMRIVLNWKTSDDLDSHLTGPDNLSGQGHSNAASEQFHVYWPISYKNFYYATNINNCSGCSDSQLSDNVTLDIDSTSAIGSSGGPETVTIAAVRSGTYRYYVHNFSSRGTNNTNLSASETSVKIYYNNNGTTTVTTYNVPNSAGDLWTVFSFDISSGFTFINEMGTDGTFTGDIFAPKISEVTAVTTPTGDTTPNYTFSSNEAGTISYGGSCSSSTTSANADNNTITFNTLSGGTYSNCTITVTDSLNNVSNNLTVSSFILDTTAPSLSQVTAVATPTSDNTSNYTFNSTEAGTITYGGSCSSADNTSVAGNNTITFNELADNTYSNCTIRVTDNVSNTSSPLSVSSFKIDTTSPTLSEVTVVPTPDNDSTPAYTFSSNEAGTITYGGDCSSTDNTSVDGNNTITFDALADGAHSNCTVSVTDSAGNPSSSLSITSFTVAIPPTLAEVSAVPNPTPDNTSSYTFSSNEAGTITYGGSCSSNDNTSVAGNNEITFNELADGTYDNCTIAVTDNTSNTSANLPVSEFTIGAIKPALKEVTAVPTLTNDNATSYTFYSTLAGTIDYGGSCSSNDNTTVGDDNKTITFNALADNTYSDCTLRVTSNNNVVSDNLSVNSFTIDTTAPSLSVVTPIPTATNDTTPEYIFSSNEAGTITYGGSCTSTTSAATTDNNTITFNTLSGGAGTNYSNCTITVTDNASNASSTLSVNSFTIDTVTPTLSLVTAVPTPDNDSTPNYTFSSSEAGAITYGGDCSSTENTSVDGNNEITFNALSDGTHSNCTITVTDNASNASSAHTVQGKDQLGTTHNSFTIGATKPALLEITAVPTPSSDNTSSYIFYSTLSGSITYGGDCASSTSAASADNNTVTFNALADGSYSNCTVRVTSNGFASDALPVTSFTIDTIAPILSGVTIRSNNSDNTKAKVGHQIILSITSSEATQSYTVSIAGQPATVSGSGTSWQATYTMPSSYSEGAVSFSIAFSDLSGNAASTITNTTDGSAVQFDKTAPSISQVTAVTTPTGDTTPNYTFSSNEAGSIIYGGSCTSDNNTSVDGNNEITFNTLSGGTYSNCTITVTDNADNPSSPLSVNTFTIDTTAPTLSEVTAVPTPTSDNASNYTFHSSEAGTITYAGDCSSTDNTTSTAGNKTITFNELTDGPHSNCKIKVTDAYGNQSNYLDVASFTVGATKPALEERTPVPTLTNDNETSYIFYSTLSGSITVGSGCTSDNSTASASNNSITFNALADGTYNCTITVTGTASGVASDPLSVSSFTIDTAAPSLSEVTPVTTPTGDTTPDYVFSSNEAGTIAVGGNCNSSKTNADNGSNTITFGTTSALSGETYSNCTIRVTDNASNVSSPLSVSSFRIDTTAPTLSQETPVTTLTNDNTPNYTFSSNEAGTITYGGGCSSTDNTSVNGNNEITFNALSDDTYSSCTITVTDNVSNPSSPLSVSSFRIDTTVPTLSVVTAVTTPTNETTPDYTFNSSEAGTNSYGGSCGSSSTSATSSGDNTIALTQPDNSTTLSDNTSYSTCTITVTDLAGNPSTALTVNTFVVDTTAPTVSSTSPSDNESSVSISKNVSVTFSESMGTASVTTNTSNTSCSGSLQLSSDSFSSCVQMGSSPSSSDNLTFTVTPSPKMFYSKTYKIRVTTAAEDSAGNNIAQSTQTYGFKTSVTFPMTAGSAHSCYMLDNGSVKCWGSNTYGQLGLGNTTNQGVNSSEMGDNLDAVDLGSGIKATAIAAGGNHTCAILDNESIKCWGYNVSGQLGLGDINNRGDNSSRMGDSLPAVDLGSGITAKAIAAGGNHTCAILDNESIKCWGKNASGQLGIGDTNNRGDGSNPMGDSLPVVDLGSERTAKVIVAGGSHTCTILDDSSIKCWGENDQGQLGLGNTTDSLNASVVDMGSGITAKAITAGESHTCAILNNSAIKCWGRANEGQMGLFKWNINIGSGSNQMGTTGQDDLTKIGTGRTAVAIAAGKNHNCAILDNSSIKCWGANTSGQLGIGDTVNRGATQDGSDQMGDNLPVVDLGSGRTARGIIAGDNQTCAILDNSSIKCWGANASGQLGQGDTNNRGDGIGGMGDNLPSISF